MFQSPKSRELEHRLYKNGWEVVEEYDSDDLASDSKDKRMLKRAREAASRIKKPTIFQPVGPINDNDLVQTLIKLFFVLSIVITGLVPIGILCIYFWSKSSRNPTISFLCCLVFQG